MRFRSPLLSQSRFLSFPPGTEMVHFPGFARARLWIHRAVRGFYLRGFPHSEISGSMPACGSPKLIAACHVLHRLLLPRHPPCALSSLTTKFTRHTATSRPPGIAICIVIPSEARNLLSFRPARTLPSHHTPLKLYGPLLLLIAHTRLLNAMRTSSFSQALIKIYVALYLPNLFSCQISSSSAFADYPACAGMGLAYSRVCKLQNSSNPMFGVKTTFIGP